MRIGGLQKLSLIDYPGKLAAVIFTQGCNFRCPYCYNAQLVLPEKFREPLAQADVFEFLQGRKEYLQGVVVTGGEPTQQADLISFLDKIRQMGYLVKLDTNGSHPQILKKIIALKLINFIAMDVKAPLDKYMKLAGVSVPLDNIRESIQIILNSDIAYQFRTTVVKSLLALQDIKKIVFLLNGTGNYVLQQFRPSEKILDKNL